MWKIIGQNHLVMRAIKFRGDSSHVYLCLSFADSLYFMDRVGKLRNSEDNKKLIQSFPRISEPVLSKSEWAHNFPTFCSSFSSLLFNCAAAAAAKSLQLCPTLCDPIDGSPPGTPVPGILQARTLEWVAISFSNAWKWKVKVKSFSRVWLLATPWTAAYQAPLSMDFPGRSTGVGCHCLLTNY